MKRRHFVRDDGKEYILVCDDIPNGDYIFYASYYNAKNGKASGRWKGVGWYTTHSHAIRGFRRLFPNNTMSLET